MGGVQMCGSASGSSKVLDAREMFEKVDRNNKGLMR
jgi:hypothetical protein